MFLATLKNSTEILGSGPSALSVFVQTMLGLLVVEVW